MIDIKKYVQFMEGHFPTTIPPWLLVQQIEDLVRGKLQLLKGDYKISKNIAIHQSAIVEENVVIKGPAIISENCFVGAHAYIRGGVFLSEKVKIGPGCEIKTSIILRETSLAHFNFSGDSIIGSNVNFEAGAVIANHYNERANKEISVFVDGNTISTKVTKFGALVGDGSKIGANAVLSPGTILKPDSIVKRLALIEQVKEGQ
jgi:UDP-N-acetylglucosamine diphosphorylase / glucose-1-phosphate thymidylyltransferase / UDP-N-acetylgalactosamine diphosphorylase / glucosamine-1-phosphate N-acetyltransferase / galactosamine-1-phosphate N-acetyltransferase